MTTSPESLRHYAEQLRNGDTAALGPFQENMNAGLLLLVPRLLRTGVGGGILNRWVAGVLSQVPESEGDDRSGALARELSNGMARVLLARAEPEIVSSAETVV